MKLTDATVRALKAKEKQYDVRDDALTGFGVRVFSTGRKAFFIRYTTAAGRRRMHTIGDFLDRSNPRAIAYHGTHTTAAAREEAHGLKLGIKHDQADPAAEREHLRSGLTVDELCDRYLRAHEGKRKSHDTMANRLRIHVRGRWGSWPAKDVTWHHVQDLHQSLHETPYEANRVLARIRHLYNWAAHEARKYVPNDHPNPATGHERYAEKSRDRWLDKTEVLRLRQAAAEQAEPDIECAVNLLLELGCRKQELLSLTWRDVLLERGTVTYRDTKNGEDRTRPFSDAARVWFLALARWRDELLQSDVAAPVLLGNLRAGWLFPSSKGKGNRRDIKRQWEAIRDAAGLEDVRIHDLRRTFGTMAHASGFPLHAVGQYLGHKSPKSTEVYARIVDDQMRDLANAVGGKAK